MVSGSPLGFKLAMREGLDYFFGISVVLARMGEQFEQQSSNSTPSKELLNLRDSVEAPKGSGHLKDPETQYSTQRHLASQRDHNQRDRY